MKFETIATKTIKPSSPTLPNDLSTVSLTVFDQCLPPMYIFVVLFYTNSALFSELNTCQKLKTSLSQTLTRFYPFAGRNNNGVSIDCNDEGALFLHARVDSTLLRFLKSPDFAALQQFLPLDAVENPFEAESSRPLLLVKATYFRCGGLAIGVGISHDIADTASLSTFIRAWAATSRGDSDAVTNPEFTAAKFFPPASDASRFPFKFEPLRKICATKRFVFEASKITELRAKAASADIAEPTRVETITVFLWKCAVSASKSVSEKCMLKVLIQPINLRPKIPSLLHENVIGNVLYSSMISEIDGQGEVEIQDAVIDLRSKAEELKQLIQDDGGSSLVGRKILGLLQNNTSQLSYEAHELCGVSSWCKFSFYEANFGWGSPVWAAGNVAPAHHNSIFLIDSNDGKGIEAWVTLPEENMSTFEQNPELLAFASPNPSVMF